MNKITQIILEIAIMAACMAAFVLWALREVGPVG